MVRPPAASTRLAAPAGFHGARRGRPRAGASASSAPAARRRRQARLHQGPRAEHVLHQLRLGRTGRYTKVDCSRHECALCEECAKQQGAFGCGSQGEQACSKEEAERAKASLWGQYPDPPPPPPPSVPPSPPPPPPPSPPPPAPSPPDIFSVGDVDSFRDAAGIAATPAPPRGCRLPSAGRRRRRRRRRRCCSRRRRPMRGYRRGRRRRRRRRWCRT